MVTTGTARTPTERTGTTERQKTRVLRGANVLENTGADRSRLSDQCGPCVAEYILCVDQRALGMYCATTVFDLREGSASACFRLRGRAAAGQQAASLLREVGVWCAVSGVLLPSSPRCARRGSVGRR